MEHHAPGYELFGIHLDLAALLMIGITSIIVLILAISGARKISVATPSKLQNFMEWTVEFVEGIIGSTIGSKHGKGFIALGLTLIMYIFVGNMLGLPFSVVTEDHVAWWKSPTADIAVTGALTVIVIFLSHYLGITRNTKHYFAHYFEYKGAMLILHLIEVVSKPLTLAFRLYGNIYAGEIMISVILGAGWYGFAPLAVWQGFSVFVGAIQAFVFTMLTMVYISQTLVHEEEH
ncbi:F0F1 ATP synthase subunit A [Paenibacillus athensensis]|uniref:ATP synthase subunit a n=1 Tax=Paenibacillus athensensis TaxID=1967502 RepID=A0A4Y8Q5X9_9BACL|nr:F0F1 ATP synthase subunit A [Paenibacillus athensensis]MCD1260898.1 F0F1 ATP synthase subunit A [Paenibacillus athensensis]